MTIGTCSYVIIHCALYSSCEHAEDEKYIFADETPSTVTPNTGMVMSVSLPPSLFQQINDTDTNSTGLVFTLYKKSTLFPVGRKAMSTGLAHATTTKVGTNIIAASVGRDIPFENLQDPVTIILQLENQNNVRKKLGSVQHHHSHMLCLILTEV